MQITPAETNGARRSTTTTTLPTEAEVLASFRGPPPSFIDVGHSQLAYRKFGAGPDIVFIHGWPFHSATYRALVPLFAGSFTCHLLDLPGAGQTRTGDGAPVDTTSQARTVTRAIDALGLHRFALVGQDSGGLIARLVAAGEPRAAGLVLANTEVPKDRSFLFGLFFLAVKLGAAGLFLRSMRSRAIRRSHFALGGAFFDKDLLDGDFHELFIEPFLKSSEYRRGLLRVVDAFDVGVMDRLDETHAQIRCPSLLIWGPEDPFFPTAPARRMLPQFAGGARLVEIPRTKLLVYEERPREFAGHALPFLKDALG